MLTINNVMLPDQSRTNITRPCQQTLSIDGANLLALPGLIDPHVHFRVPGMEEKEDWQHASLAALRGGITTVFDMPNTKPATVTQARFEEKVSLIDAQLAIAHRPLRYKLFFGASKANFHEIVKVKDDIVGIKVFMGSSTGDLLMADISSLHAIYALAKAHNLLIALHAEDEEVIKHNIANQDSDPRNYHQHSLLRCPAAAVKAVNTVIELTRIYGVRSYILHISTTAELELIASAKAEGLPIYAETCPHYLFLSINDYPMLQGRAKMNPPLRQLYDCDGLWEAINIGLIDTIASDHAPHTIAQKDEPFTRCPAGVPGIETTLPLLLTAWQAGKISLDRIIALMYTNPKRIFQLVDNTDLVLVDIVTTRILQDHQLATKCKWSPFSQRSLTGFPKYVIIGEQLIELSLN